VLEAATALSCSNFIDLLFPVSPRDDNRPSIGLRHASIADAVAQPPYTLSMRMAGKPIHTLARAVIER
jgi:hypothetical protein